MQRLLTVSWKNPADLAEQGRRLPGIEFLRAMRDGELPPPPIAELLGFRLVEVEAGHAVFECIAAEQHYNPIGMVHGGLAMTLLDSVMGCCIHTRLPAGIGYTTLEVKTNFVKAISDTTGTLRAIGKVLHLGKRVATAEGRLEDASGKLYAHATTTCMLLSANS